MLLQFRVGFLFFIALLFPLLGHLYTFDKSNSYY